ncbi:MAG: type IV pilus assembly protein FimV [Candidatus Acidiferrales bacterium]
MSLFVFGGAALAQSPSVPAKGADEGSVEAKVQVLSASLDETRQELAESRQEIKQLRVLLEQLSQRLGGQPDTAAAPVASDQKTFVADVSSDDAQTPSAATPAKITQDDWDILNSRLQQLTQTRVESGSKFSLKLSGMFLLNTIINSGRVDNFDLPRVAISGTTPFGSTGFSLRQSVIGIEGNGPQIVGAKTSADIQGDVWGGLGYGESVSGIMRLRLARMRMDWAHTSIIGGLDTPFFSPDSPTSYLTVAEPGFSAAGNLWTWAAQLRVEQRFDAKISQFRAEAGILGIPSYVPSLSGNRVPSPNESSRQPVYAVRLSANGRDDSHPYSVGVAGIYLRQRFPGPTTITGGGGMIDWNIPLFSRLEVSGEMFAGKGLDGFGAVPAPVVAQTDYTEYITNSAAALAGIPSFGGWSQLKFRINSRDEINLAFGGVGRKSSDFQEAALNDPVLQNLAFKNGSLVINYIFRPRSDLVFSAEYRRLQTYRISGQANAGETGLTAGFLF